MSAGQDGDELGPDELLAEYRALLQFVHLAPVGLIRAGMDGRIVMMNPMASQLLSHVGFGAGEPMLFDILEPLSPDLRLLVQAFQRPSGLICDNYRVMLPASSSPDAPLALGVSIHRLRGPSQDLMVVISDQTQALRLQHLQGGWMR